MALIDKRQRRKNKKRVKKLYEKLCKAILCRKCSEKKLLLHKKAVKKWFLSSCKGPAPVHPQALCASLPGSKKP